MRTRSVAQLATVLLCVACAAAPNPTSSPKVLGPNGSPAIASAEPAATDLETPIVSQAPSPESVPTPTPSTLPVTSPSGVPPSYAPPIAQPVKLGLMGSSGWNVVSLNGSTTAWSPDGSYILTGSTDERGTDSTILVSSGGDLVRQYPTADYVVWLDTQRFMLIKYGEGTGDRPNIAKVGTVADAGLTQVDVPKGWALSSQHGAVAFATLGFDYAADCGFGCPMYHFRVWGAGPNSDEREGEPVAWSPDGSQLFVLHDVRKHPPGTGAPAAQDFVGWLEILSLPDLQSVRAYPDTTSTDRSVALDPSGTALLYETVSDVGANEYVHILDLSNGAQKMLDVNQRSFGWASPGEVVIAPQMANPVTHYDGDGQPTYMAPVHGTATLYAINGEATASWSDVGQDVASTWDGSAVALYDDTFIGAQQFVSVFANGQRLTPDPLPVDHYLATCGANVAPHATTVAATCSLIVPGANVTYFITALHSL